MDELRAINTEQSFFDEQRQLLVKYLRQNQNIKDEAVLTALNKVPRHQFLNISLREVAYLNSPLDIGYGQTISQPYIVAYMTEAASIFPDDKVLEIGTGCGYQTAILAELAQWVYSVEIRPQLTQKARQTLSRLEYTNINLKTGDGYQGWPEAAFFDAILVTAAPPRIPVRLVNQLAAEIYFYCYFPFVFWIIVVVLL